MIDLRPLKHTMIFMAVIIVSLIIAVVCLVIKLDGVKEPARQADKIVETVSPRFQWYDGGHGTDESIYVDTETGVLYLFWDDAMGNSWGSVIMGADGLPILAEGYSR